jgi:hypothetical protein
MVAIDQFLEELCPLNEKSVFRTSFLFAYRYSYDIWYISLPYQDTDQVRVWCRSIDFSQSYGPWTYKNITNYQFSGLFSLCLQIFIWYLVHCFVIPRYRSSSSLVSIHWFFPKLWPFNLEKISWINHFPDFLSRCLQIFIWYLVHFVIPRYRSSLSLVLLHWFFPKLWPLNLEKYHELSVFRTFSLSAYRYSFDIWFIALPYQDTDHVQVWFWSIRISRSYGPWT